jgi:hypothetical protein
MVAFLLTLLAIVSIKEKKVTSATYNPVPFKPYVLKTKTYRIENGNREFLYETTVTGFDRGQWTEIRQKGDWVRTITSDGNGVSDVTQGKELSKSSKGQLFSTHEELQRHNNLDHVEEIFGITAYALKFDDRDRIIEAIFAPELGTKPLRLYLQIGENAFSETVPVCLEWR